MLPGIAIEIVTDHSPEVVTALRHGSMGRSRIAQGVKDAVAISKPDRVRCRMRRRVDPHDQPAGSGYARRAGIRGMRNIERREFTGPVQEAMRDALCVAIAPRYRSIVGNTIRECPGSGRVSCNWIDDRRELPGLQQEPVLGMLTINKPSDDRA